MGRPAKALEQGTEQSTDESKRGSRPRAGSGPCPHCQALEARIAELEAAAAKQDGEERLPRPLRR